MQGRKRPKYKLCIWNYSDGTKEVRIKEHWYFGVYTYLTELDPEFGSQGLVFSSISEAREYLDTYKPFRYEEIDIHA